MRQTIDVTGPAPEAVRAVELIIGLMREKAVAAGAPAPSIFDVFGRARHRRTGEEIAQQIQDDR